MKKYKNEEKRRDRKKLINKWSAMAALALICLALSTLLISCDPASLLTESHFEYTVNTDGKTCTVTGIKDSYKNETAITIPSAIDGYTVTDIRYSAFADTELGYVSFPDTLKTIGANAFKGCKRLSKIEGLENCKNLISIGNNAFEGCEQLKEITLPGSVMTVGKGAFKDCIRLVHVVLPSGLTEISDDLFHGCSSITSIDIPSSVIRIGEFAFKDCVYLEDISIPEKVNYIGRNAFDSCYSIKEIDIPSGVTKIYSKTFLACINLLSISIPEGVKVIGEYAFDYCISLASVELPVGLEVIEEGAFVSCQSLREIIIPEGVKEIRLYAFNHCQSLERIEFPSTLETFTRDTFTNCQSLSTLIMSEDNPKYCVIDNVLFNKSKTALVFYPSGKTDGEYTIPDGVESVLLGAISFNYHITTLNIPSSVTFMGKFSLYELYNFACINYSGTVDEWHDKVTKSDYWQYMLQFVIYCTDGDVYVN